MIPNIDKPNIEWDITSKIITKYNIISDSLCEKIIEFGLKNAVKGQNKYPNVFKTKFDTCLLPINHEIHHVLEKYWLEIADELQFTLNFIEPYECKRYKDTDFFGSHVDNYYGLKNYNYDRKVTMVIQLSDVNDYQGGGLKIVNKLAPKDKGSITAFPSFLPHEVLPIVGCRWSVIGWGWGPYWK